MSANPNWYQDSEGWHQVNPEDRTPGYSPFDHEAPPVRDGETGHPIGPDGNVDWGRVIQEINERDGH